MTQPGPFPELALRRVLVDLDQGWSPVAADRPADEEEWGVLKLSAIKNGRFIPEENKALDADEPRTDYEVKAGDVLVSRANTPELVGDACYVQTCPASLMLSDLMYRLQFNLNRVDPRFITYSLLSDYGRHQLRLVARGSSASMIKISQGQLKALTTPLPALDRQKVIADFLDRKTAAIDALIEKKERLIEVLEQKRASLIHRAVTRGLDPDVPMKDSGVPWIGEIPEHWEVLRMQFLCSITTGSGDTQDAAEEGDYPFFVRSDEVEKASEYTFDGEAVLTSGDGAGVGKIFHYHVGKLHYHQRVYLFHNFRRVNGRYLYYFIRQHLSHVVLEGTAKSTVDSIRRPMLTNFPIAFGPAKEQAQITEFLNQSLHKLDASIQRLDTQIGKLQEYRQSLITAAVTGQLDKAAPQSAID